MSLIFTMEQVGNYSSQLYLLFSSAFCWSPSFDAVKQAGLAHKGFPKVFLFSSYGSRQTLHPKSSQVTMPR